MHTKRIIPCLDVKDGQVVKGVNFVGLKEIGDPIALAKQYYEQGADELVFLDITATHEVRNTMVDIVEAVAKEIHIPFTVGGGIKNVDDMKTMLRCGADKVSLNSAAVKDPSLIQKGAEMFGSQCIVIAIDAKQRETKDGWNVVIHGGRIDTGIDVLDWVKQVTKLGAGEILLTSMDADGTKQGFDIALCKAVNDLIEVPLIASGGCGALSHFYDVFAQDAADAALAASLFHYNDLSIHEVKQYLSYRGIAIRNHVPSIEEWISRLDFDKQGGLIPVIVQDEQSDEVLMLAYMSKKSLQITMEKGLACYFSRSRNCLWLKGETSNHFQHVKQLCMDCDHDTLLMRVEQDGAACHTQAHSCFYTTYDFREENTNEK